jgi:rhodanese-related sulfurtransferase
MYAQDHIVNTYNLPYNNIAKMSTLELNNWFKNLIDLHYPLLKKLIKSKKLEYYELPLICYCAHNKCSASKTATINLMKKGFVNVNLYEDGLKGYKKHNKQ